MIGNRGGCTDYSSSFAVIGAFRSGTEAKCRPPSFIKEVGSSNPPGDTAMRRLSKWVFAGLLSLWMPTAADAQIWARPVAPNPLPATGSYIPQTTPSGTVLLPVYTPPPSQYKTFYGPSVETWGIAATTSYYIQPTPNGERLMRGTVLVPVYGYMPGYYSGYDTARFFRP
jgi:hypothetical protein